MVLYKNGQAIKRYTIALGFTPEGHKQFEGDADISKLFMDDERFEIFHFRSESGFSTINSFDEIKEVRTEQRDCALNLFACKKAGFFSERFRQL